MKNSILNQIKNFGDKFSNLYVKNKFSDFEKI